MCAQRLPCVVQTIYQHLPSGAAEWRAAKGEKMTQASEPTVFFLYFLPFQLKLQHVKCGPRVIRGNAFHFKAPLIRGHIPQTALLQAAPLPSY